MEHADQPLRTFLADLASEAVAPAGGTAAAVAGAIGAATCEMACVHTLGRDERDATADVIEMRNVLGRYREHLLGLANADAEVVDEVFAAPEEDVGQADVKRSIGVPLTIADACLTVVTQGVAVVETAAHNAVADAITGVLLARSALQASVWTVRRNLDRLTDPAYAERVEQRVATIEASLASRFEDLPDGVDGSR